MLAAASGCAKSTEQRLQIALAGAGLHKTTVYPFAGTVTIDGQPPDFGKSNKHLLVILYDLDHPDVPVEDLPHILVKKTGQFAFTTYGSEDGIEPGHYAVTFAAFRRKGAGSFIGPDQLHNLYNDPDLNANNPQFKIDHQAPGKKDYAFDLQIAGKESTTPGPHALTTLASNRRG